MVLCSWPGAVPLVEILDAAAVLDFETENSTARNLSAIVLRHVVNNQVIVRGVRLVRVLDT